MCLDVTNLLDFSPSAGGLLNARVNAEMFSEYLQFIANRRFLQIGLPEQYPGAENPFPWMSEMLDLKKEKTFFETRVIVR